MTPKKRANKRSMNKFFGHSADAAKKRLEQKERWNKSELATNEAYLSMKRGKPKLGFKDSYVVFHSAIATGDQEECGRLLEEGYDINCVDADGLTALHHVSSRVARPFSLCVCVRERVPLCV